MKKIDFTLDNPNAGEEYGQEQAQQTPEPSDEAAEVVAGGGEGGVAVAEPEIIAAHAALATLV